MVRPLKKTLFLCISSLITWIKWAGPVFLNEGGESEKKRWELNAKLNNGSSKKHGR